jgi:hypothetical protein
MDGLTKCQRAVLDRLSKISIEAKQLGMTVLLIKEDGSRHLTAKLPLPRFAFEAEEDALFRRGWNAHADAVAARIVSID